MPTFSLDDSNVEATTTSTSTDIDEATSVAPLEDNKRVSTCSPGSNVGGVDDTNETTAPWTPLEDYKRVSKSIIWKLSQEYYNSQGVKAWSSGTVPHYITNNAFIGRTYARLLHALLTDALRAKSPLAAGMQLTLDEKFYIIEIGAGAGKSAFFMLRALRELADVSDFPINNIVYVLTDASIANVKFWMEHPALEPFAKDGVLDFALFDALNDEEIRLMNSGRVLSKLDPTDNPICMVANYAFDTLCHDAFQVEGDSLKECRVSVGYAYSGEPDQTKTIAERLSKRYEYRDIEIDYYSSLFEEERCRATDNTHYRRILSWYKEYFSSSNDGGSFMMPIGPLQALQGVADWSRGKLFVIAADKAYNDPEQFRGLYDPFFAKHGSLSVTVNYHALALYVASCGGFAVHNEQEDASLQLSCFVLPGDSVTSDDEPLYLHLHVHSSRASQFPLLCRAFSDQVDTFGINDFFALQQSLVLDACPRLSAVMALIRFSGYDCETFYKLKENIIGDLPHSSKKQKSDLSMAIARIWDTYFLMESTRDIPFELGRLCYHLLKYDEALDFYQISTDTIGKHHITYHNMGLCMYSKGDLDAAISFFNKALEVNGEYQKSMIWVEKVEKEIAGDEELIT